MLQIKPHTFNAYKNETKPQKPGMDGAIKGYILNNQIKPNSFEINYGSIEKENLLQTLPQKKEDEGFDAKNALKPLLILAGGTVAAISAISVVLGASSKHLAASKSPVRPPDLARNINIVEEPHFAMYRALRDPNAKNILGLIGVGAYSAITLGAKNFVDGVKEIWIKKQENDIKYDFERASIDIETRSFSGKLGVIDKLLNKANNELNFKGLKKEEDKKEKKKINPLVLGALGVGAFSLGSVALFKNYQKIVKNLDTFVAKTTDAEIKARIAEAVNINNKTEAINKLTDILKTINAPIEKAREHLSAIKGINEDEIAKAINSIKESQIYVKAPEALGGVSEKIQYYCYINEDRGHLYNWILNPENKFNKYIFLSFSAITSLGYLAKSAADAIKCVTVQKENTKNELNLKNKLVDVEIKNFESKKKSAIEPMIENYKHKKSMGASKEELNETAQNILLEIKNGPPYVYD